MLERMKQHPKKATALLVVMLVMALLAGILWPSGSGIVHAESINVTYDKDIWDGYDYSKYPSLAPTNTVAKAGYKIKSLKVVNSMNNQLIQTISAAEGQTSYTFSGILFSGIRTKVSSKENRTTQGYYAWYRYAKGTNGNNWHANFARVDDSYNEYGDSRTSKSGDAELDSYGMPAHPGNTDNNLSLTGIREKEFYTDGNQWVDTRYISHDELTGSAIVNGDDEIGGPPGEGITGKAKPATISLNKVDAFPDLDRIIVRYAQDFNYVEDNFKPLAAYGAALMVYFSAFTVDLESYTYQYPYKLDVEWEALNSPSPSTTVNPTPTPTTAPTMDDLEVVSLTFSPSSFTVRDDVKFTYVFRNNSNRSWSNFYYNYGGGMDTIFTGTLKPGETYTGSWTRKVDSPLTVTVKIDSRNLIPEFNEANNEKTVTAIPNAVTDNNPPEGRLRWFYHGTDRVADTVVEGTPVDLKYVDVKDPDHDPVGYRMNFSDWHSTFYKTYMTDRYTSGDGYDAFTNISTVGAVGSHIARGRLVDPYGGYTDLSASLTVIPPNPVARCAVPSTMKSRRPLPEGAINANKSYSPLERAIDHSRDEWTNNLPFYVNDTDADTTETIILEKVYDNTGLASLNRDGCQITVKPDLPPIAKIVAPALGIRGEDFDIVSESQSPDGDEIVEVLWYMRYDANNDGVFSDTTEPWTAIIGTPSKYVFHPAKIGKYKFKIKVKEDYGKEAEAESSIMDVVNLPGEVSFDIAGNNPNPDSNLPRVYTGEEIKRDWGLVLTNSNTYISKLPLYNWRTSKGSLLTGGGKGNESARVGVHSIGNPGGPAMMSAYSAPLNNNGRGKDGISIYKAFANRNPEYSQPLYFPSEQGTPLGLVSTDVPIASDNKYLYVGNTTASIYALNKSKVGGYELKENCDFGQYSFQCSTAPIWKDGSPYDYTVSQKDVPDSVLQTQSVPIRDEKTGQTHYASIKDTVDSFAAYFAEKYIYAVFQVKRITSGGISYSEDDSSETYYKAKFLPYACSFRAEDKQLVSCFSLPGENDGNYSLFRIHQVETKGSNLLLLLSEKDKGTSLSFYGYPGSWQYEVNHKGEVIHSAISGLDTSREDLVTYELKQYVFPQIYTPVSYNPKRYSIAACRFDPDYNAGTPYDDGEGNHYVYVTRNCRDGDISIPAYFSNLTKHPELNLGVYLTKYDSNYKFVWRTKLTGTKTTYDAGPWGWDQRDSIGNMIINTKNRTLIAKSLVTQENYLGEPRTIVNDLVNIDTGYVQPWTGGLLEGMTTPTKVDAWGNYTSAGGAFNIYNQVTDLPGPVNSTLSSMINNAGSNRYEIISNKRFYQEYVGDGLLLSGYNTDYPTSPNPPTGTSVWYIDKGDPVDSPSVQPRYEYGQFISNDTAGDSEISYTFSAESVKSTQGIFGFSFRMQDGTNRYSLEFDGTNVYLSRYLWGNRTILASSAYNIQNSKDYTVKIRITGNLIHVWINKVPYFVKIEDSSLASSGRFGPFSNKSFITFRGISVKPYAEADIWGNDYAILDEGTGVAELNYSNINFIDPEGDPMAGDFFWTFTHQPLFLNNKGLSPLSGKSYSFGLPTFDRVGKWEISLKAKDDPAPESKYKYPNAVFDSYRQETNSFKRTITVHRRPVTHELAATVSKDGDLQVTDNSYDPDRYDISNGYAEPGYAGTKGVFERRYVLVSPSNKTYSNLIPKLDESGTWVIGLQVRDEFGAWSFMETVEVEAYVKTNHPPTVVLTYPGGMEDSPILMPEWSTPTITWIQNDQDPNTIYTASEVEVTTSYLYEGQPRVETKIYTKAELSKDTNGSYSNMDLRVSLNRDYKVRVRVRDEDTWSEWSNYGYYTTRIKPTVELTYPLGTVDNPTYVATLRPTFTWNQNDPAAGGIIYQEIEVLNENGSVFVNRMKYVGYGANASKPADSWTMESDVTVGSKMQVRVRVRNMQGNWSSWSNIGWFTTNRPPSASMAVPDGSEYAPTMFNTLRPTFVWYQTDPDPGTVFTYFQIQVTNEANNVMILDSGQNWQNTSSTTGSWQASSDLPAGQKLRVRVRVFDGHVWSDWSAQTWFYINRPPVADFDWSPKPVWEGDAVRLTSLSYDPDGDALTYRWHIVSPSGQESSGSLPEWTGVWMEPGGYRVTLIVSDGLVEASAQKTVEVLPLTIEADIFHTPDWFQYHVEHGHETAHAPKDFFAGEKLLLHVTSAPAPVHIADAYLEATGIGGKNIRVEVMLSAGSTPVLFEGVLYDPVMGSLDNRLPDGLHEVHFRLVYSNGVVKETTVPFRIIGSALGAVGVHRVQ